MMACGARQNFGKQDSNWLLAKEAEWTCKARCKMSLVVVCWRAVSGPCLWPSLWHVIGHCWKLEAELSRPMV